MNMFRLFRRRPRPSGRSDCQREFPQPLLASEAGPPRSREGYSVLAAGGGE